MYPFIVTLEGNALHGPILQKDYVQLENQWETPPEDLQRDLTKLVEHQNPQQERNLRAPTWKNLSTRDPIRRRVR